MHKLNPLERLTLLLGGIGLLFVLAVIWAPVEPTLRQGLIALAVLMVTYQAALHLLRSLYGARLQRYLQAVGDPLLVTMAFLVLGWIFPVLPLLYLFVITNHSVLWERRIALLSATASSLGYALAVILTEPWTAMTAANAVLVSGLFFTSAWAAQSLLRELKRRNHELSVANEFMARASTSPEPAELLQTVLKEMLSLIGFEAGYTALLDERGERLVVYAQHGLSPEFVDSMTGAGADTWHRRAIESGQPWFSEDLSQEASQSWEAKEVFRAAALLPLCAQEKVIGLVGLATHNPHHFSSQEKQLLSTIADQLGPAVEKARLLAAERVRSRESQVFLELAQAAHQTSELTWGLQRVAHTILEASRARQVMLLLLDEEQSALLPSFYLMRHLDLELERAFKSMRPIKVRDFPARWQLVQKTAPFFVSAAALSELIPPEWARALQLEFVVLAPLRASTGPLGLLVIQPEKGGSPSQEGLSFVQGLAQHAALAIEKALLSDQAKRQQERWSALKRASAAINAQLDLAAVLETIVQETAQVFAAPATSLVLLNEERTGFVIKASTGLSSESAPSQFIPLDRNREKAGPEEPIYIADLRQGSLFPQNLIEQEKLHSLLSVPLMPSTEKVGELHIYSRGQQRIFDKQEVELAKALAGQASIALQNAQLYEALRKRLERQRLLQQISAQLSAQLNLGQVLPRMVEGAVRLIGGDAGWVALLDEATQSIRFPYLYNLPPELSEVSTPLDAGVTAQILASKRPVLVEDYAHHPRRLRTFVEAGVKSGVGAPLLVGERAMGTLAVVALWQSKRFSEEDAELLRAVADQAAVAIENARLYESTTTQLQQIESLKTFNESIVEGVSEGISIEDLRGLLTFVNPRLAKMLGYTREELLGQPWNSLIAPQDRAVVAEETAKYPLGVPTRYEVSFRRKDGSTLPVILSARPLFREGTFVGVLAVSTDISDRKQAEKELESRTRELAALHAIAETVNRSLDLDQILTSALDQVLKVMEIQAGTIHILEPASETLQLKASFGLSEAMQRDVQQVRLGEGFSGRVARTGEPIMIEDYGQHPYRLMREASDFRAFASIPLKSKERVWGTLSVIDRRFRNFKAEDLSLLIAIGNEIAVAVENAHLYAETKRHLEEVSALHSVAMAASSVSNLEDVLARITETLRQALGYESGGILLLDEERGELTLHRAWGPTTEGHPPFQVPLGRGITGWVAQTGEPLLVPEVTKDRRYVPAIPGTQSEMCAPLRIGQRIIGVLNVESPRRNAFTEHDLALLDTLASQVASTIENARLHQQAVEHAAQLERRTDSLALIHSVSKAVSSTLELEQIFRIAMEEMVRTFRVDQSAILLFDADKGYAKLVAEHQPSATAEPLLIPLRGNPAMERILSTRQPLAIEDVQSDPLLEPVRPVMVQRGIHSSLIVPLIAKDELIGTIGLDVTRGPRRFTAEEIELAQTIAQEISGAIERARLYEETKRLAITDSLTGLYNVRYFYQELDRELVRSRRYERPLSLIMMDIDNFKRYNDTYGHLAGDDLLRELAALLNEMIRRTDILARYGGEEFMIVLPETDAPETSALAERIAEQVRNHPFAVRFSELKGQITISCGVATFPQHAQTSRDLVHAADTALYQAKGTKDRIFTFEVARKDWPHPN